jgi:hypothetical protein
MQRTCVALLVSLPACVSVSDEPMYPAQWPPRTFERESSKVIDLSGTYRAVSDPAPALEYPHGGHPQEYFCGIPIGPPEPLPPLGRRVLAWHLAGIQRSDDGELWTNLERFAAALGADADHPDGHDDIGWVTVVRHDDRYDVQCGVEVEALVSFELAPIPRRGFLARWWTLPQGYSIDDGALVVHSAFPASSVERWPGTRGIAGGTFTFWRTVDGSLVMLEALNFAPAGGEINFRKWWRWRRVESV